MPNEIADTLMPGTMMNRTFITFLQAAIVLFGVVVLALLLWLPSTEGRATNLDWLRIYSDPFILYGYAASIAFFVVLVKIFILLGYIGQNRLYSSDSVKTLKVIKNCSIILGIMIVGAGLYIKAFHNKDDDPAGFLAMCILTTFITIVVAGAAARLERSVQKVIDMRPGSNLTT